MWAKFTSKEMHRTATAGFYAGFVGQGILQSNGNVLYDINMGKIIGTNGEDTIRIITKGYSNNIIIAFPLGKGVN